MHTVMGSRLGWKVIFDDRFVFMDFLACHFRFAHSRRYQTFSIDMLSDINHFGEYLFSVK